MLRTFIDSINFWLDPICESYETSMSFYMVHIEIFVIILLNGLVLDMLSDQYSKLNNEGEIFYSWIFTKSRLEVWFDKLKGKRFSLWVYFILFNHTENLYAYLFVITRRMAIIAFMIQKSYGKKIILFSYTLFIREISSLIR